jgi:uncharacterized protein
VKQGKATASRLVLIMILILSGNGYAGGDATATKPPVKSTAPAGAPVAVPAADAATKATAIAAYDAKNYREALRLFQPLAEKGDAEAQYYVGRMYEKGQGVSKDQEQVVKWYTLAAQNGHAGAQYRLAVGHAYGFAGLERDEQEAGMWLQRSAEGGHKKAQKYLGRAYADGRFGLRRDPVKAEYWTKKSEEK